jgi:hemolysin activation/secretion protein
VEVQRRRTAGWELGLQHRQASGSMNFDASVAWRQATAAMDALPAPEDAFGEGASRPRIASADISLLLPVGLVSPRLRFSANWRGQASPTALVPQDRFAIGGRYTVRGFDGESVLSAQRGWLLRNELAWTFGAPGPQAFLGLDYGQVGGAGSERLAGTRLSGAVAGLRGAIGPIHYEVFVGGPLHRPEGFRTAHALTGFSLFASF